MRYIVMLALIAAAPEAATQTIYKCVGPNGETQFSQRPCSDSADTVDVGPTNRSAPPSDEMNEALRQRYRKTEAQSQPSSPRGSLSESGGEACRFSRATLQKYELQWKTLRRRGYTVADENRYTDLIADWQGNVKMYCR